MITENRYCPQGSTSEPPVRFRQQGVIQKGALNAKG
jgi:hypothetical protein